MIKNKENPAIPPETTTPSQGTTTPGKETTPSGPKVEEVPKSGDSANVTRSIAAVIATGGALLITLIAVNKKRKG